MDNEEVLRLEPAEQFDKCIRGVAQRFNSRFLVYDRECVVAAIAADMEPDEDQTAEEMAEEYYGFNTVGAWVGEGTPAFLEPWQEASGDVTDEGPPPDA